MQYVLIVLVLMFFSCQSTKNITHSVTTSMRRMPQINKVDNGVNMKKGDFMTSLTASYAFTSPEYMYIADSGVSTKTNNFGETVNTFTARETYSQESRASFSGEGLFALHDYVALGLSMDATVGKVRNYASFAAPTLQDNSFEGSLSLRFSREFNKVTVVLKPELILAHIYGDYHHMLIEDNGVDTDTIIARERLNNYTISNRCSSILRYQPLEFLAPFVAFQIKSQPFYRVPDALEQDLAMGFFGGVDFSYKGIHCAPFVSIPMNSATGNYHSPISGGVHLAYLFKRKEK